MKAMGKVNETKHTIPKDQNKFTIFLSPEEVCNNTMLLILKVAA